MNGQRLFLLTACLTLLTVPALALDWPQWRGPDRTDVSKETGLLKTWPKEGPKLLWTFKDAGAGYSGPSIVGERLYCLGYDPKHEFVFAVDVKTGEKLWSTDFVTAGFTEGHGDGPRANPTVDGDYVYVLGGKGQLACLKAEGGQLVWSKNVLEEDLGGVPPANGWGYSESVLVDGDQVVCTPGGKKGTMAALNKMTGEVIWRSSQVTDAPSFSSPIVAEVNGVKQYVQMISKGVVGVAPKDGKVLWHYKEGKNPTAAIPTPIYRDGYVYVTRGYDVGCDLIKLTPNADGTFKAEKAYANKNMINHHGGVILIGDYLYGYSDEDKEKRGSGGWTCQDFKTGDVKWSDKSLGKGSVSCADGMLYCYDQGSGAVTLVEATPSGWKETGRFSISDKKSKMHKSYWTHPVVANGHLYVRDQDLLFCFDVKAK